MRTKLTIDYGGTWVRFSLSNPKKNRFLKVASVPLKRLPHLIEKTLNQWGINFLDALIVGGKGVWKKEKKRGLHSKLKRFAKKVSVLSDIEFTYNTLFGNKPGILLIAGTGSIAFGKDGNGKFARAGGLGPKKGDEGSGYWIGKEYLKRTGIKNWEKRSVRNVASLAKLVLKKSELQDPLAQEIVKEAQQHLSGLVQSVSKQLRLRKFRIHCHGGLFKNQTFKKSL